MDPKLARKILDAYYWKNVFFAVTDAQLVHIANRLLNGEWITLGEDGQYRTRNGEVLELSS